MANIHCPPVADPLPRRRKIGGSRAAATRPVHMVSDAQQVLAECFLSTLQSYLRGLVADLKAHCITDVSASLERVRCGAGGVRTWEGQGCGGWVGRDVVGGLERAPPQHCPPD